MQFSYSLSGEDFLTHFLYSLSQSEAERRRREQVRRIGGLLFLGLGAWLIIDNAQHLPQVLFGLGSIGFAFFLYFYYPIYLKNRYKSSFRKLIDEKPASLIDLAFFPTSPKPYLIAREAEQEARIAFEEIEVLVELDTLFLLRLDAEQAIILPKRIVEEALDAVTFKSYFSARPYLNHSNWTWR